MLLRWNGVADAVDLIFLINSSVARVISDFDRLGSNIDEGVACEDYLALGAYGHLNPGKDEGRGGLMSKQTIEVIYLGRICRSDV